MLAVASGAHAGAVVFQAEGEPTGLVINVFWILIVAANFLVFLVAAWYLGLRNLPHVLAERRARIEQGLRDADAARQEREHAAEERLAALAQARQEASDLLARAQKLADENRQRDLAQTKAELERLREQAAADIEAERQRAMTDVRAQVADLALLAAGRVVGETMSDARQRRLVDEFLSQVAGERGKARR